MTDMSNIYKNIKYDILLADQSLPFTVFKNSKFRNYLDENDITLVQTNNETINQNKQYLQNLSLLTIIVSSHFLRKRNIILQLARRQSFWEFTKKYMILPAIITEFINSPIENNYRISNSKIYSKYDFKDDKFREAYQLMQQQ